MFRVIFIILFIKIRPGYVDAISSELLTEKVCLNPSVISFLSEQVLMSHKSTIHNIIYPVAKTDVKFYLYTAKNPKKAQIFGLNDLHKILKSNFNKEHPIKIMYHGFRNSAKTCPSILIRNAYLRRGNFNVIMVDWSKIAARLNYVTVIRYLRDVADAGNELATFLHKHYGISFGSMYLLGHSLGVHIAGLAGRRLKYGRYNTIFGIEPAGLTYYKINRDDVINKNDADYVETINTDIKGLGYDGHLGTASIYPNFGKQQKICAPGDALCNHYAALVYFVNTIDHPGLYKARRCKSLSDIRSNKCECDNSTRKDCNKMYPFGGEPSYKKSGIFYINIEK